MTDHPYKRFTNEQLILRDVLAADRTQLSNERTLLAYIKTALTLFIGGITLIKLFPDEKLFSTMGEIGIPLSFVVAILGYVRFVKKQQTLNRIISKLEKTVEKDYNPFLERVLDFVPFYRKLYE